MVIKMNTEKNLFFKSEFAEKYDESVKKQKWFGAEILFGMIYEYLTANDRILDIGIGTGLSATAFHRAGMEIYGLDFSDEMLEICKQKNIAVDLQQFDLNNTPLPYQTSFFDHISANAVLYFLPELDALFSETSRIIKKEGIWAFVIEENDKSSRQEIIKKPRGKNGLVTYRHSREYILNLIRNNGFSILKKIEFVAENFQMEGKSVSFQVYVTEKL
jgi:predicted TPR repeat methyltransferase